MEMIVVGVDGSEESHAALSWALDEARVRGAAVRAVHAWQPIAYSVTPPSIAPAPFDFREDMEKEARQVLEEAVAQDAARGDVQVRAELVEGPPAVSLLAVARDADLLVVGSRGRGGFSGLLLGSVSQQCAHHTPCPLVVVRRRVPAATEQTHSIVVGVDGSSQSEAALHWGL